MKCLKCLRLLTVLLLPLTAVPLARGAAIPRPFGAIRAEEAVRVASGVVPVTAAAGDMFVMDTAGAGGVIAARGDAHHCAKMDNEKNNGANGGTPEKIEERTVQPEPRASGPMIPMIVDGGKLQIQPTTASQLATAEEKNLGAPSPPASSGSTGGQDQTTTPAGPPEPMATLPAAPPAKKQTTTNLPGISYAPYAKTNLCKTPEQVAADIATFSGVYSFMRLYGVDCGQVTNSYEPAKRAGLQLFLGIYDLSDLEGQVGTIVDSPAGRDWGVVHTVSVGNERVNSGISTPAEVIAAVATVRRLLRAAGYAGPVVAVDTFITTQLNPELCDQSDYCAINAHAFFTGTVAAQNAGDWLVNQVAAVRAKLADKSKRIVVTETGWPHKGNANLASVPSLQNQADAMENIRARFADNLEDIILFSAFNDLWKKAEASTYFAEPWWGIRDANSSSD